ncbi:hypothetical protein EJB05_38827 [Eragrostis curvula]|uniref:DUF4378 domain-containing protein n=1 Tax=Eragrostis curvula TaxID=38414 RepID=A0A5J9TV84_9POAL|nr:hypothetical protein EJB05_38827 [Eragrostis curvula]
MAQLTPRAASSQLTEQMEFCGGSEDDEYLLDALHRRDESLLSSVYSNGYGGDESSFSRSEVDYIDEEGGNLSDSESEVVSQVSQHSWDDIKRYSSTCSGSRFSRTSRSPETSVTREAKKRLSERWASVAYDGTNQEQMQPRRSSTLGEMLSLREAKKDCGINSVSTSRPCDTDNELTQQAMCISQYTEDEGNRPSIPENLARSKSVPVSSSMFDNIAPNDPSSNSEGCKTPQVVTRQDKGKLSFKGKVSSFFFPKSKRQSKEKVALSSASSYERGEVTCLGNMKPEAAQNTGAEENRSFLDEKDDSADQTICSSKDIVSIELPISSDCPSGDLDGLRSCEDLKGIRDEPSPTSVLDASFEDSNINESESSRSITYSNGRDALQSTGIESVTRSLSWEDMNSSSPSSGSTKLAPFSHVDDDELECVAFVQKILASAGLDDLQLGMVFSGWYLPDCPLDSGLCDKLLDRKEEAAKSRERRSNQKLLFDCVNMALIEIGEDALLCTDNWSQARSIAWREMRSQVLGEVPRHMKDWLYGSGKFVLSENDDAETILERIVQQEVNGRGWMKSMRWQLG